MKSSFAGIVSFIRAGIVLVLLAAVVLAITGRNVAVWIDSNGLPSIDASGPNTTMAIPIAGTLEQAGLNRIQNLRGMIRLDPGAGNLRVVNSIVVIAILLAMVWILGEFRALLQSFNDGHFFTLANAVRLRKIGWVVILSAITRSAIVYFETSWAATHVTLEGFHLKGHLEMNAFAIGIGLVILRLAEAWREGVRLKEDQSLTV